MKRFRGKADVSTLTMMINAYLNRQCSAFQSIEPYEYPLGVNEHTAVLQLPLKLPPEDYVPPLVEKADEERPIVRDSMAQICSVTAGTVATYALHNYLAAMGPVQASSIVAIASTLLLKEKLALPALCGSFAGMVSTTINPTFWLAFSLGIICAGVLTLFDKKAWFVGYGGRLGFISQCACTLLFLLKELLAWFFGSTPLITMLADFSLYQTITVTELLYVILFSVVGALFMRLWKHVTATKLPSRLSNSVAAVGMTGLIGGFFPSIVGGPAFCGSFVAMASPTILPDLFSLVLASVLAGASQLALTGFLLGGWGGKLGAAAFMGVVLYLWLTRATNAVASIFQKSETIHALRHWLQRIAVPIQPRTLPR